MMPLLQNIAEYLANKLDRTVGQDVFYYELPDEPDECVAVVEVPTNAYGSVSQIAASMHRVRIYARHTSNVLADELASSCFRALKADDEDPDTNGTGFLKMPDGSFIYVFLRGEPVWEKMDQRKRRLFTFEAIITSEKL